MDPTMPLSYDKMALRYIIIVVYSIVFPTAAFGNIIFLAAVKKNARLHTTCFILLANECLSDLIFLFLSLFYGVEFVIGSWVFGDVICRVQAGLIEISYTVSSLSLCAVAMERYLSIRKAQHKTKKSVAWTLKICVLIWLSAIGVCSPLFYAYSSYDVSSVEHELKDIRQNNTVVVRCGTRGNKSWFETSSLLYHCIHDVFVYLLPLVIMLFSHSRISAHLKKHTSLKFECSVNRPEHTPMTAQANKKASKENARNKKIMTLLMYVTLIFFVLWTPYIIARLVNTTIRIPHSLFAIFQNLILASTVPNFFITLGLSKDFRNTVASLLVRDTTGGSESARIDLPTSSIPSTNDILEML